MFVKFRCIFNMKLNSIFHERNACLSKGILDSRYNLQLTQWLQEAAPIIEKKIWFFMYCKSLPPINCRRWSKQNEASLWADGIDCFLTFKCDSRPDNEWLLWNRIVLRNLSVIIISDHEQVIMIKRISLLLY